MDYGRLHVIGPYPAEQTRTCVAGMSCTLAWFTGESLSNGDSVIVMDTCGTREPPPGFEDGLAFFDELATCNATSNEGCENTDRIFRSPTFFGTGGEYRLCWCASGQNCTQASDFNMDFGRLLFLGPSPIDQVRTCVTGQSCHFDGLTGPGLQDHPGSLLALETCGSERPSVIAGFGRNDVVYPEFSAGWAVNWGDTPITAVGGYYRLCWCASMVAAAAADDSYRRSIAGANHSNSSLPAVQTCSVAEQFRVDTGVLLLVGPSPDRQDRYIYIYIYRERERDR